MTEHSSYGRSVLQKMVFHFLMCLLKNCIKTVEGVHVSGITKYTLPVLDTCLFWKLVSYPSRFLKRAQSCIQRSKGQMYRGYNCFFKNVYFNRWTGPVWWSQCKRDWTKETNRNTGKPGRCNGIYALKTSNRNLYWSIRKPLSAEVCLTLATAVDF